ncbi:hypothetical protein HDV01_004969 [Terramyces sp. JEL0728]|nr:hypothetical protein HDV01_004969 [Terramyces sp. JEL0728]
MHKQSSVHYQQRLLLDALHLIYLEMDERHDRSYLDYLSNQDKEELLSGFNESVFYHAMTIYYNLAPDLQLITDLRESGQHLFNVFNLTLTEINQRTMNNPLPPYKDLL